eukprot:CAMPEP_0197620950 /NCGR_PEP_ID=MMETSP1338-20131121/1635_1 /TAXON_ID=43686 ORGANISM="Pelagodinium beii, Strain RCC1491" /NCGR_SAMPLE_ID=MMETSP1338 /ASSEMBLY_ACC=CAM_ASM_000754 /LENGTH=231 /DNA_ID=CAMNT_0043190261 /DNA_START=101 /DNA_END=796 /DNA_ORIENTATION=+
MKIVECDDEAKLREFYDKRISQEVDGSVLGAGYSGYTFKISGGNDKQGFAMMQGVLTNRRVRLLLNKDSKLYRPRRKGERKKKSVRGCIVGADLATLNLVITEVKEGALPIPGLTDVQIPRRLGPKRVGKIRALFGLSKDDDVRQYVLGREFTNKKGKRVVKKPKIQRLVTPTVLQRKRRILSHKIKAIQASRQAAQEYARLFAQRAKERRESERARSSRRRSSRRQSARA